MKILSKAKITFAAIGIALLSLAPVANVSAATPYYGKKFQNGVGNISVWLDYSSGVGYWQSFITLAANNWMYTGVGANPIYINFVGSNNGSNIDFYRRNNSFWSNSGILAETRFYLFSGSQIVPTSSNWYYTNIYINHDEYSKPSFTDEQARGTTIHEMGHAFGLAHYNTNVYSVMCQTGYGRVAQRVQKTDNDTINILY